MIGRKFFESGREVKSKKLKVKNTFGRMILLIGFLGSLFVLPAEAKVIYVDNDAPGDPDPNNPLVSDPAEDGSIDHPFDAIQEAIDTSVNEDTIIILPGIYTGDGNRDIELLGKAITVRGSNPDDWSVVESTIIDCQGSDSGNHRGFYIGGGGNILQGLTITGGYHETGGGIYCRNSSPMIERCRLIKNQAQSYIGGTGGGIANFCDTGGPKIRHCIFAENEAGYGGGWFNHNAPDSSIYNCLFHHNSATECGGGLLLSQIRDFTILHCTFSQNQANQQGGAIYCYDSRRILLKNSILWQDTAPNGPEVFLDRSNIQVKYSNIEQGKQGIFSEYPMDVHWEEGNLSVEPNFKGGYDFHLQSNSPCIDTGTNELDKDNMVSDLDGNKRLQDGDGDLLSVLDMGAYEFPHPGASPLITSIPDSLLFAAREGGINPADQTFYIWNTGSGTMNWQISEDCSWLSVNPNFGIVKIGYQGVDVSVDVAGLSEGKYMCELAISDSNAANTPLVVTVSLWVMASNVKIVPNEYATIQDAINASSNGDEVVIAPGCYTGTGNYALTYSGREITVRSVEPTNPDVVEATVIDCEQRGRGFRFGIEDIGSIVQGLTIQNGVGPSGGGIYCDYGAITTIQYCVIKDCEGPGGSVTGGIDTGGGIAIMVDAHITICDCRFENNTAYFAGGAIIIWEAQADIQRCVFQGNSISDPTSAFAGGAIYNGENGQLTVRDCVFQENEAPLGGAIRSDNASTWIYNCLFKGNQTTDDGYGGAIYGQVQELGNCVFSGNSACYGGGLAWCDGLITGCTILGNSARVSGGGLYSCNTPSKNCIIRNNRPDNLFECGEYISYCCVEGGYHGLGNIDTDPLFVESGYWDANGTPTDPNDDYWVDGDYHLQSEGWRWDRERERWDYDEVTSPCIDAGNPGTLLGEEPFTVADDPENLWGINKRINMGAYGGTAQASMGPHGWALLGDLTNNGIVNLEDFSWQAGDWLETEEEKPGDLNRDGVVDFRDLEMLRGDWLDHTSWYE